MINSWLSDKDFIRVSLLLQGLMFLMLCLYFVIKRIKSEKMNEYLAKMLFLIIAQGSILAVILNIFSNTFLGHYSILVAIIIIFVFFIGENLFHAIRYQSQSRANKYHTVFSLTLFVIFTPLMLCSLADLIIYKNIQVAFVSILQLCIFVSLFIYLIFDLIKNKNLDKYFLIVFIILLVYAFFNKVIIPRLRFEAYTREQYSHVHTLDNTMTLCFIFTILAILIYGIIRKYLKGKIGEYNLKYHKILLVGCTISTIFTFILD